MQLYLNFYSTHPEPCKTGLVYGQALQIVERCSEAQDVNKHLENLTTKLKERNYPEKIVKTELGRANQKDRKSQIYKNKPTNQPDTKVRLIFTYNQNNPPIHKWIKQSKKYLDSNERAKELGKNLKVAYKQPKKIEKLVGGP